MTRFVYQNWGCLMWIISVGAGYGMGDLVSASHGPQLGMLAGALTWICVLALFVAIEHILPPRHPN